MSLNLYIDGAGNGQKRRGGLALSVAMHASAFFLLIHAPGIRLPEPAKSEYKQAIAGKEEKLVWFKFKELPDVAPPRAKPERKPLRATARAKQEIVASRRNAPKRKQMIWTPAPELRESKPVESPNILAVRMPEITKPFVAPPDIQKTAIAKIALPDAPELKAQPLDAVKLADAPKIVKRFVLPPRRVPRRVREAAPLADAPQLEASANVPAALNYRFKTPARPFTPPAANKEPSAGKLPVEAPPVLASNADLNIAVVGLNPSDLPIPLPANSSPASFSAAPKIRREGADTAGAGKGLSVPDLFVRGAHEAAPGLLAQTFAAPTSALTLRAAGRGIAPRVEDPPEPSHSGAVKVSNAPDPRFDGRDVYMMAIQMPNLTSYSGSWLLWYSDRTARVVGIAPVSPPVAHRKVDPKYVASAAAERIEGKIQLACVIGTDGRVSTVELVRGLDDRLNRSAEDALSKWEFTPATRHGVPVAVDVVVEIPFRLAPRSAVRY